MCNKSLHIKIMMNGYVYCVLETIDFRLHFVMSENSFEKDGLGGFRDYFLLSFVESFLLKSQCTILGCAKCQCLSGEG